MDHNIKLVDKISNLPWDILDNILGRLPIDDAVRTSILSTKWKDKWVDLSKIVVDDSSTRSEYSDWDKLAKLVYHVLLSHRGHIETFMLATECNFESGDLDKWIHFLSRSDIKELILDLHSEYALPYSLFFCEHLRELSVSACSFESPPGFTGFSNLVSLHLERYLPNDRTLESLISKCPVLETLVLLDPLIPCSVIINAPNLKYLYMEGEFCNIKLENSPHLTDASIKMIEEFNNDAEQSQGIAQNLVQPFGHISPFERLTLSGYFLRFLATRQSVGVLIPCDHLKVLDLSEVRFYNWEEALVALSILRSSSNLKELHISVVGPVNKGDYDVINIEDESNWFFNQLRVVEINIFEYSIHGENAYNYSSYLKLIYLLLAGSPVLEAMTVNYTSKEDRDLLFMRELLSFNRASAHLIIKFTSNLC